MAIKNEDFINIIRTSLLASKELLKKINEEEYFLDKIVDIRLLHRKLSTELEEYLSSPHYDQYEEAGLVKGKSFLREVYIEIKNICEEIGIEVFFTRPKTEEFKKRIFAYYKLSNIDINGLIFYNRKTKVYEEDINDLSLD